MGKIANGVNKINFTILYDSYCYIIIENFPQKSSPCIVARGSLKILAYHSRHKYWMQKIQKSWNKILTTSSGLPNYDEYYVTHFVVSIPLTGSDSKENEKPRNVKRNAWLLPLFASRDHHAVEHNYCTTLISLAGPWHYSHASLFPGLIVWFFFLLTLPTFISIQPCLLFLGSFLMLFSFSLSLPFCI